MQIKCSKKIKIKIYPKKFQGSETTISSTLFNRCFETLYSKIFIYAIRKKVRMKGEINLFKISDKNFLNYFSGVNSRHFCELHKKTIFVHPFYRKQDTLEYFFEQTVHYLSGIYH